MRIDFIHVISINTAFFITPPWWISLSYQWGSTKHHNVILFIQNTFFVTFSLLPVLLCWTFSPRYSHCLYRLSARIKKEPLLPTHFLFAPSKIICNNKAYHFTPPSQYFLNYLDLLLLPYFALYILLPEAWCWLAHQECRPQWSRQ